MTVYLDHVVAARPRPEAVGAMRPFLDEEFGHPSSRHAAGRRPREAVRASRSAIASLARRRPEEVVFTSGPAEAASFAIRGLFSAPGRRPARAVASAIESAPVLHTLRRLGRSGVETTLLSVDGTGRVDPDDLKRALTRDTALVAVQTANAEIGTVQELPTLIDIAHGRGAAFLADASQSAGLLPLPEAADMIVLSARSLGGPGGVGAAVVREGLRMVPLIEGGVDEEGMRGEPVSVCLVAGFGAAAALPPERREEEAARMAALGDEMLRGLRGEAGARLTGSPVRRIPGHASVVLDGVDGEAMLLALDRRGICASSASPCADEAGKASATLAAIGLGPSEARSSLVFSLGWASTPDDVRTLLRVLPAEASRLRTLSLTS